MKLATFKARAGWANVGLVLDDEVVDLTAVLRSYRRNVLKRRGRGPETMLGWIEAGLLKRTFLKRLFSYVRRQTVRGARIPRKRVLLLAPIPRPPKIFGLGLNYAAHAAESGREPPEHPIVFAKAPTCVVGHNERVVIKRGVGRVDPEVELAVVIGRAGADIAEGAAMRHVAGYTIMNDVTARDMQRRDLDRSHPWLRSKSIDTFGPMGPWIVTPDEIPDPHALDIEIRVNGTVRQHANTRQMIFPIPRLIAFISQYIRLEPGDVISTGTPEGIAPVAPGDVMECTIEGIGTLRNPVVLGR